MILSCIFGYLERGLNFMWAFRGHDVKILSFGWVEWFMTNITRFFAKRLARPTVLYGEYFATSIFPCCCCLILQLKYNNTLQQSFSS